MGLPTTWGLLCIIHLFWVAVADAQIGADPEYTRDLPELSVNSCARSVRICGDDLLGVLSTEKVEGYERCARACGAKFSVRKHYRSKHFGFFTEQAFRFKRTPVSVPRRARNFPPLRRQTMDSPGRAAPRCIRESSAPSCSMGAGGAGKSVRSERVGYAVPARTIPLRWAAGSTRWQVRADFATRRLPVWASIGPAAYATSQKPGDLRLAAAAIRAAWPGLARFGSSVGLNPYLPRELGGLGLPALYPGHKTVGQCCPRWMRQALAGWLYRQPIGTPGPVGAWLSAISPSWASGMNFASAVIAKHSVTGGGAAVSWAERIGTLDEVERRLTTSHVRFDSISKGRISPPKELGVSAFRVARALRKWSKGVPKGRSLSNLAPLHKILQRARQAPAERIVWAVKFKKGSRDYRDWLARWRKTGVLRQVGSGT